MLDPCVAALERLAVVVPQRVFLGEGPVGGEINLRVTLAEVGGGGTVVTVMEG